MSLNVKCGNGRTIVFVRVAIEFGNLNFGNFNDKYLPERSDKFFSLIPGGLGGWIRLTRKANWSVWTSA